MNDFPSGDFAFAMMMAQEFLPLFQVAQVGYLVLVIIKGAESRQYLQRRTWQPQ